ncbi:hypothetical protein [Paludisphaera mucosa]|uniref:Carboxypeptidase regulatory-like domain-containing protein n=1 Tax=Paludisphaera mucosa TaxID=3030827 RepID=A0ABT6FJS8_9BACT|nr:hypothetical protein [Paludisphaera mucosa]MDG3007833.1 hypothetical protein [Paludisphaera mucosa]
MRPRPSAAAALASGLAAALLAAGCGGSSSQPPAGITVPAKGVVTYKGKPLAQGTVVFEPDAGREAHGAIQADGSFVLTTFAKDDGAVPGLHRVAVTGVPKNILPLKFQSAAASKVEIEVADGKADYPIDLK